MEIKIKLKVKDVEIELTTEEAKELSEVLKDLTGGKGVKWYPWYTNPWPYKTWDPVWINDYTTSTGPQEITVTCCNA